ncbi:hypothetical protein STCU_11288 [Strigomonas culicis]|uniref:Uncharacterized protein n=1 Tax=Strigomonas culicis TaxID=28005 RepID=S9THN2_9TRYP|nr:hypothetical protein STCU_11288 [Strigomonas culicis]|eukprot:EPY16419.1 hypothetical protein STCU_11288 [Strigomonas culicis]
MRSRSTSVNNNTSGGVYNGNNVSSTSLRPISLSTGAGAGAFPSAGGGLCLEQVSYSAVAFEHLPSIYLKQRTDNVRRAQEAAAAAARKSNRNRRHVNPFFDREFMATLVTSSEEGAALFAASFAAEFFLGLSSFYHHPLRALTSAIRATVHRLNYVLTAELVLRAPPVSAALAAAAGVAPLPVAGSTSSLSHRPNLHHCHFMSSTASVSTSKTTNSTLFPVNDTASTCGGGGGGRGGALTIRAPAIDLLLCYVRDNKLFYASTAFMAAKLFTTFQEKGGQRLIFDLDDDYSAEVFQQHYNAAGSSGSNDNAAATNSNPSSYLGASRRQGGGGGSSQNHNNMSQLDASIGGASSVGSASGTYEMPSIARACFDLAAFYNLFLGHFSRLTPPSFSKHHPPQRRVMDFDCLRDDTSFHMGPRSTEQLPLPDGPTPPPSPPPHGGIDSGNSGAFLNAIVNFPHAVVLANSNFWEALPACDVSDCLRLLLILYQEAATLAESKQEELLHLYNYLEQLQMQQQNGRSGDDGSAASRNESIYLFKKKMMKRFEKNKEIAMGYIRDYLQQYDSIPLFQMVKEPLPPCAAENPVRRTALKERLIGFFTDQVAYLAARDEQHVMTPHQIARQETETAAEAVLREKQKHKKKKNHSNHTPVQTHPPEGADRKPAAADAGAEGSAARPLFADYKCGLGDALSLFLQNEAVLRQPPPPSTHTQQSHKLTPEGDDTVLLDTSVDRGPGNESSSGHDLADGNITNILMTDIGKKNNMNNNPNSVLDSTDVGFSVVVLLIPVSPVTSRA